MSVMGMVVAEEQRTEDARSVALSGGPASDHQFLLTAQLHLAPRRRPPTRLVSAVQPLGHETLEMALLRDVEQRLAVAHQVYRHLPTRTGLHQVEQESAS